MTKDNLLKIYSEQIAGFLTEHYGEHNFKSYIETIKTSWIKKYADGQYFENIDDISEEMNVDEVAYYTVEVAIYLYGLDRKLFIQEMERLLSPKDDTVDSSIEHLEPELIRFIEKYLPQFDFSGQDSSASADIPLDENGCIDSTYFNEIADAVTVCNLESFELTINPSDNKLILYYRD